MTLDEQIQHLRNLVTDLKNLTKTEAFIPDNHPLLSRIMTLIEKSFHHESIVSHYLLHTKKSLTLTNPPLTEILFTINALVLTSWRKNSVQILIESLIDANYAELTDKVFTDIVSNFSNGVTSLQSKIVQSFPPDDPHFHLLQNNTHSILYSLISRICSEKLHQLEKILIRRQERKFRDDTVLKEYLASETTDITAAHIDAYQTLRKAVLIGSSARSSMPLADMNTWFEGTYGNLRHILATKSYKDCSEINEHPYLPIVNKRFIHKYNLPGAVQNGWYYAFVRTKKYCARIGYSSLAAQYIARSLQLSSDSDPSLSDLYLASLFALTHLLEQVGQDKSLSYQVHAMICGLRGLVKGLQKENITHLWEMNDPKWIIDVISLHYVYECLTESFSNGKALNLEQIYDHVAGVLSIPIISCLKRNKGKVLQTEHYYQRMVPKDYLCSDVLVDQSCSKIMWDLAPEVAFDYDKSDRVLPAFYLPGVIPNVPQEHGYYAFTGDIEHHIHREVTPEEPAAFLGKNTETKYELDDDTIRQLIEKILEWAKAPFTKQSTNTYRQLFVDITIEPRKVESPDLVQALFSHPEIKHCILTNRLDIYLVKSEQKQQSLGTGRYSAGSACLVTADISRRTLFNLQCKDCTPPDENIASFYREYAYEGVCAVVDAQCQTASALAKYLNEHYKNTVCIANGSNLLVHDLEACAHIQAIFGESFSFGFSVTTQTSWTDHSLRLSIGLESLESLIEKLALKQTRLLTHR